MTINFQPQFLYGTAWKEERTETLAYLALEQGFRGIDTANQRKHYFEKAVGKAVQRALDEGLVKRDELFLQTKFTHIGGQDHRLPYEPDAPVKVQVQQSFESSRGHLGKIDSLLLHGPSRRFGLADVDVEAYEAMAEILNRGEVNVVGVSNVSADQLREFCDIGPRPHFVQNRCFARLGWDAEVREVCQAEGIVYQGFSLLTANIQELNQPQVRQLAARRNLTLPQLVFAFAKQLGMLPLTGTSDPLHMKQDLAALSEVLEKDEVKTLLRCGMVG